MAIRDTGFKQLDPWILAAVLAALCIRLINLDEAALWFDETLTAQRIELTWNGVIHDIFFGGYNANQVPLYFLMIKAWSTLAGSSPMMLRLPSVILSVVTVALIAGIARTTIGEKAARWAGWLAAISPYLLHHAQEARMYPLISALAAASILLLARFLRGSSPKLGTGFVLVNLALLSTHYYAMFIVSAIILVPLLLQPRPLVSWLPAVSISGMGVLSLVLAALFVAGHQSGELYNIGWLAFPGVGWSMLSGYALLPSSEELHTLGLRAVFPYLILATAAIVPLSIVVVAGLRAMNRDTLILILITLIIPLLAPFLVRIVFPDVSINPRYAMSAAPSFLVLLGAGLAHGFTQHVTIKLSALTLAGIMFAGSILHLVSPGHGREDIYAAGDWLDLHIPVNEEILVTSSEMYQLAVFHWPERQFRLHPGRKIVANRENSVKISENTPFPPSGRSVFIFGRTWLSDPDGLLQDALTNRYTSCPSAEFRGIRILCLNRPTS